MFCVRFPSSRLLRLFGDFAERLFVSELFTINHFRKAETFHPKNFRIKTFSASCLLNVNICFSPSPDNKLNVFDNICNKSNKSVKTE